VRGERGGSGKRGEHGASMQSKYRNVNQIC
jgi:hypothetical protein